MISSECSYIFWRDKFFTNIVNVINFLLLFLLFSISFFSYTLFLWFFFRQFYLFRRFVCLWSKPILQELNLLYHFPSHFWISVFLSFFGCCKCWLPWISLNNIACHIRTLQIETCKALVMQTFFKVFKRKISLWSLASLLKTFIKHKQKTFVGPSGKELEKEKKNGYSKALSSTRKRNKNQITKHQEKWTVSYVSNG